MYSNGYVLYIKQYGSPIVMCTTHFLVFQSHHFPHDKTHAYLRNKKRMFKQLDYELKNNCHNLKFRPAHCHSYRARHQCTATILGYKTRNSPVFSLCSRAIILKIQSQLIKGTNLYCPCCYI